MAFPIVSLLTGMPVPKRVTIAAVVVGGLIYGAVMGSFGGWAEGRWLQMVYSSVKVPLLVLGTAILTLPSFFVFHSLLGVADDFRPAVRAVLGTQGAVAIILASFAPLTAVWYLGTISYREAIAANAVAFGLASIAGQFVLRARYRPLEAKSRRHRFLRWLWIGLYAFVGIQMGWVLRPFIGDPGFRPSFLRDSAWGNAYVVIFELVRDIRK